jgi:hypothetical protein
VGDEIVIVKKRHGRTHYHEERGSDEVQRTLGGQP